MTFDTTWNIEKYKSKFESEEHWDLKRDFLQAYKHKFPEDKLVCLAQCYVNMELMGCSYPAQTMEAITEMGAELAKDFREKKANKEHSRTFVTGTDASAVKNRANKTTLSEVMTNELGEPVPKKKKVATENQQMYNNQYQYQQWGAPQQPYAPALQAYAPPPASGDHQKNTGPVVFNSRDPRQKNRRQ